MEGSSAIVPCEIIKLDVAVVEIKEFFPAVAARSAVDAFPGVKIMYGAVPKEVLKLVVRTVALFEGLVPVVNVIFPAISLPIITSVGDVPAPVPAVQLGAAVPPTRCLVFVFPFTSSISVGASVLIPTLLLDWLMKEALKMFVGADTVFTLDDAV